LPCPSVVGKKEEEKDFLTGNVISTSISLGGIREIQRQVLAGKRGLLLKEATSAVCDVHATCRCQSLLSLFMIHEVKNTRNALQ